MKKRLAILHTSFVFIQRETMINDLLAELLPEVEVLHFIDSEVLAQVMRESKVTDESIRRMTYLAQAADSAQVDLILSSCSSLGPAIDVARHLVHTPIVKIDEAMATTAAEKASRIGVLATVPTTLGPTSDLIREKAADHGKVIEVFPHLCTGAFETLMKGNRDEHDGKVLAGARELAPQVEILVLAQASMTRLAPSIAEATSLEVLTSPRLGIEHVRRLLA